LVVVAQRRHGLLAVPSPPGAQQPQETLRVRNVKPVQPEAGSSVGVGSLRCGNFTVLKNMLGYGANELYAIHILA